MKKLYFLFIALIAGTSAIAQTVTTGDMESWRNGTAGLPVIQIHAPSQWFGVDSLIIAAEEAYLPILFGGYMPTDLHTQIWQESTIKHGGSYSAKMMTQKQDTFGRIAGVLSNARVILDIANQTYALSGGQPITNIVESVSAWVQYTAGLDSITHLPGIDSGLLTVSVYGNVLGVDSKIGTATLKIGPSTSFQHITANVVYTDTTYGADTIRLTFSSSGQAGALDSSTLYVDDITMQYVPDHTGVKSVNATNSVKVYPNPASGLLYLEGNKTEGAIFQLYSVSGQVVATKTLANNDAVDISEIPEGLYIYSITDNANMVQRGKVSVVR